MKNAADESQVREASKSEKRKAERELSDLAVVLSIPEGRRVMRRVLDLSGENQPAFSQSHELAYYRMGAQDVGRVLLTEMFKANPDVATQIAADGYREKKENE